MWLTELQRSMRLTLKDVIQRSAVDYEAVPRNAWVLKWPGQVVLNVSQVRGI